MPCQNINFPYITLFMTMLALTPKRVTCFSSELLGLNKLDSTCTEDSKYLIVQVVAVVVVIVVSEKNFIVLPNFTPLRYSVPEF